MLLALTTLVATTVNVAMVPSKLVRDCGCEMITGGATTINCAVALPELRRLLISTR